MPKAIGGKIAKSYIYDATNKVWNPWDGVITTGDIEIGSVELKDATSTNRATISSDGELSVLDTHSVASLAALQAIDTSTTGANTFLNNISDAIYVDGQGWTDSSSKHILSGGIYQGTPQTVVSGDSAPFQIDVSGNIIESNSLAIKTAVQLIDDAVYADDADWTNNSSKHLLVGGVYLSGTPNSITDGDVGPILLNAAGEVRVVQPTAANFNCTEASASNIKTAVEKIDDWEGSGNYADYCKTIVYFDNGSGSPIIAKADAGGALQVDVESGSITADTELPAAAAITDAFANPTTTNIMAMNMGWDATNSQWERLLTNDSGVLEIVSIANDGVDIGDVTINNAAGSGVYIRPGTSASFAIDELTAAAALSDTLSNPTTTAVGSMMMIWDSTNSHWERVKGIEGLSNSDAGDGVTLKNYNNDETGLLPVVAMGYDNTTNDNAYRAIAVDANGKVEVIAAGSTPTIYNVTMTSANTEYSQALPTNTRKADIKLRATNALLKLCFTESASGTTYVTVPYGSSYHLENVDLTSITVYVQSPTASQTLEVVCWT